MDKQPFEFYSTLIADMTNIPDSIVIQANSYAEGEILFSITDKLSDDIKIWELFDLASTMKAREDLLHDKYSLAINLEKLYVYSKKTLSRAWILCVRASKVLVRVLSRRI